jgi:hypothetical protein
VGDGHGGGSLAQLAGLDRQLRLAQQSGDHDVPLQCHLLEICHFASSYRESSHAEQQGRLLRSLRASSSVNIGATPSSATESSSATSPVIQPDELFLVDTRILRLLESEDAAGPNPGVQIISMEATAVADLHAGGRGSFLDVAANPTFPTGPLILGFWRENLNRFKGR